MTQAAPHPSRIDLPVAVRGASAGFSVLLIGSLLAMLLTFILPAYGPMLTVVAAIIGFYVAAHRVGAASIPALHGAFAAVLSYLLVLPIWWNFSFARSRMDLGVAVLCFALAISTGSLTGWMNSHKRG
jgi:hypothetical protein